MLLLAVLPSQMLSASAPGLITVLKTDGLQVGCCIRSGSETIAESNGLIRGRKRRDCLWPDVGVVNAAEPFDEPPDELRMGQMRPRPRAPP